MGILLNFFDHQSDAGRIPIMIDVHNPDRFGCLQNAAPNHRNQAKPVFGQLALLIADELKSVDWLRPRFDHLMRFYHSWVLGNRAALGLLVWGDDVAIGDDNDPTTFGRPFFSSANMLLNSLYYQDLQAAAELARRLKRTADAKQLANMAREQGENIQKYCWDPRDRFYYTVDVQCKDRRAELIPWDKHEGMPMSWRCLPLRIQMFTGFLPMWAGLASHEQASLLVKEHLLNPHTFNARFGVRSLSKAETMYSLRFSSNPSDWLGPVWILTNYFVWTGLKNYGYDHEAATLADKTLRLLSHDLKKHGCLNEYYDPETGVPLGQKGFLDWNMLVLEMA
jgi:putative isomerase